MVHNRIYPTPMIGGMAYKEQGRRRVKAAWKYVGLVLLALVAAAVCYAALTR